MNRIICAESSHFLCSGHCCFHELHMCNVLQQVFFFRPDAICKLNFGKYIFRLDPWCHPWQRNIIIGICTCILNHLNGSFIGTHFEFTRHEWAVCWSASSWSSPCLSKRAASALPCRLGCSCRRSRRPGAGWAISLGLIPLLVILNLLNWSWWTYTRRLLARRLRH